MSKQEQQADEPRPDCGASLTGSDSSWDTRPSAVYPPGYPRLCQECFPEADVNDEGYDPDFDHTEVVDEFVRTTGSNNTTRRMHRPAEGD